MLDYCYAQYKACTGQHIPSKEGCKSVENGLMTTEVIVVESLMCFVPSLVHDDLLPLGFLLR
jgi:hypothetical protein